MQDGIQLTLTQYNVHVYQDRVYIQSEIIRRFRNAKW